MQRILIKSAIPLIAIAALSLLWIFAGRSFSLLLDRFGTAQLESRSVDRVIYEGNESGGVLEIGGLPLSTQDPDFRPFQLTFQRDSQHQFVLTTAGKSFLLGPFSSDEGKFQFAPQPGDKVFLSIRRSFLSWPTPFDFNFMSGHSPSWKRNRYYQLRWQKSSGRKLEMLWRYEQYFYPGTAGRVE